MAYETPDRAKLSHTGVAPALLRWYDANARALPWRVSPQARKAGRRADPYAVWLSEIMLQQTTVATVTPRFAEFLARWPTIEAMAAAPLDDILSQWAGLGYYARARNLHKCAVELAARGGFPEYEEELKTLPGIGDYTAAAIAAIAFDKRAVVVDGNVERVVARLFAIETPLPAAKAKIKACAEAIWPQQRSGDFAQGLMDLGAGVCRPKAPLCLLCPISSACEAPRQGRQEAFPVKPARKQKPKRAGAAFVLVNAKGEMLFERRPEKGLLGGMLGLPGTDWATGLAEDLYASAPAKADWARAGAITHVFTHFHLTLEVFTAPAPKGFRRWPHQQWIAPAAARLPTVMKKAVAAAMSSPQSPA